MSHSNEIILISGNYKSTKMADHILEMARLSLFCDYCEYHNPKCTPKGGGLYRLKPL